MRRIAFRLPVGEKEELLDALLPLLPAGVREEPAGDGEVTVSSVAAAQPGRAALEAAAGRALEGWDEEEVPADWRERRARFGGGAFLVGDRLLVRSPWDPPAPRGRADFAEIVIERSGNAFGSGSHPTTQMCLALLLELEPSGAAADLGCGIGTLAIAAARLGWAPVTAVDRVEAAVEAARANAARNGVDVRCRVGDLASAPIPLARLLLVNAPPPVHERVVATLTGEAAPASGGSAPASGEAAPASGGSASASGGSASTSGGSAPPREVRHVIVSGIVEGELERVRGLYADAGYAVAAVLGEEGWSAALLEPAGG